MDEPKTRRLWESDPEIESPVDFQKPVEMTTEEAEKLVQESIKQIENIGWVLWRLRNVKDNKGHPRKICLIRGYSVKGYPPEYPLFSLEEFGKLPEDMPNKTLNLIIHIKILGDATVESVEKNKIGEKNV